MRTFIGIALAMTLACVGVGVGVGADLQSYSPARGEFPVQSGLAQGYIRYVDAGGVERLLGYAYPEPLLGVRQLSASANDGTINPSLLQATRTPSDGGSDTQAQLQMEAQFRDWCEQRYLALKTEVQRLRAAGQKPTASMQQQLTTLQGIMLAGDGGAATLLVPVETAEVQRAREEQLRLWNEQRLRVLQLQSAHTQRREEPAGIRPVVSSVEGLQTYNAAKELQQQQQHGYLGETAEQAKAREEHLRIYNEQLQRLQQQQQQPQLTQQQLLTQPLISAAATEEAQRVDLEEIGGNRPIIGILAVKTVLSNHGQQMQVTQLQPAVQQDTPEVVRAREEHLRLLSEAQQQAQQQQAQTQDTTKEQPSDSDAEEAAREAQRLADETQLLAAERQRESERQREDERLRELAHQQELARLQAEQRQMAEERQRLLADEEQRVEMERLAEIKRIQLEEGAANVQHMKINTLVLSSAAQSQPQPQQQQQLQQQAFNLRFLPQPVGVVGVGGGVVGGGGGDVVKPVVVPSSVAYYAPAAGYAGVVGTQNPFLARYVPNSDAAKITVPTPTQAAVAVAPAASGLKSAEATPSLSSSLSALAASTTSSSSSTTSASSSSSSSSSSSDSTVVLSSGETSAQPKYDAAASLAALEQARQEHFRAHEIALEQLRVVSERDAKAQSTHNKINSSNKDNKDC